MNSGDKVMYFRKVRWITGTLLEGTNEKGWLRIQLDKIHGGGIAHVAPEKVQPQ